MAENKQPYEADIALLLAQNYKEAEMESTYRSGLLGETTRVVSSRSRIGLRRLTFAAVAGAAMLIIALLAWHSLTTTQVKPPSPQPHNTTPAAIVQKENSGESRSVPQQVNVPPKNWARNSLEIAAIPGPSAEKQPVRAKNAEPLLVVIAARQQATDKTGHKLVVGDKIVAGATLQTGKGGRLNLITRRGSEIALNSNSEITLVAGSLSARLTKGEIYCRSREKEIEQISTQAGDIKLLGTIVNTQVTDQSAVAVTVVEGKVRLENAHGAAVVDSGKKSLLVAQLAPSDGQPANTVAETAWYDGRGTVISDFGDIAYTVRRKDTLATEIWVMNKDGSNKRLMKSYLGYGFAPGPWLPGEQVLLFQSGSAIWSTPDFKSHRADAGAGHPIVENQAWLINAATGEDKPFILPARYGPLYMSISPDSSRLAFCGSYRPDPKDFKTAEGGVWVFDLKNGKMKKALNGWIKTPVAWAPDSRRIVASTGENYGTNYPLVVAEVDTGNVQNLDVQGAGAAFSPDGSRIANCTDFQKSGSWYRGVPMSGSISVIDLKPGSKPLRISPLGEGALDPHWSPDGNWVAYWVSQDKREGKKKYTGYKVYVARADGSSVKEIFNKQPLDNKGGLQAISWSPSGDAIYLSTTEGVQIVAPDGSGVLKNLGGSEVDSILSAAEKAQSEKALAEAREAVFQFALGNVRTFEGKPEESKAAFTACAKIFSGLPFNYPLAKFSANNVLSYADKATELAARPAKEVLAKTCEERIKYYLSTLLLRYAADKGGFPPDLQALEKWSLKDSWGINWMSNKDTAWVKMIFKCPGGAAYRYAPPTQGKRPAIGDMVVSCTEHPTCQLVWSQELDEQLNSDEHWAIARAERGNKKLEELLDKAGSAS